MVESLRFSRNLRVFTDCPGCRDMASLLASVVGILFQVGSVVSTGSSVTSKAMILLVKS